jgi:hypothetical protein
VTSDDVREAADRIGPYVRTTPVFATEIGGRPVTLKLENLQVTGSFKFRGALNGVIARSAGGPARSRGTTPLLPPGKEGMWSRRLAAITDSASLRQPRS